MLPSTTLVYALSSAGVPPLHNSWAEPTAETIMLARAAARAGRISSIPSRALSTAVHRGAQDFHELRERSLLRYTLKASTEGDALSVIEAMDALCAWLRMEPARRGALTPRPLH